MIILVACEKGGTGKTTIATNLATMLASRDREVLLLDEVNLAIPCPNNDCHPDQNGNCLPSQYIENIYKYVYIFFNIQIYTSIFKYI